LSIRFYFTVLNTAILLVVLILFVSAVYIVSGAMLLSEVDMGLEETAFELQSEIRAYRADNGREAQLVPPENLHLFETTTTFVAVLDAHGDPVAVSGHVVNVADLFVAPNGLNHELHFHTVTQDQIFLRVLTVPLFFGHDLQPIGYLQVGRSLERYMDLLTRLRLLLVFTGLGTVSVSLFATALLTHRLLKPLDEIAAVALQITRAGDLSRRLPDPGRNDEIGRLTFVLNQTLERLERLFQLQQRFLADVSHELRTPLTTIRGNVDLMRRMGMADPETLAVIQDEVGRMTRLVDDLMLLARADAGGLPIQRQVVELDTIFLDIFRQVSALDPPIEVTLQEIDQVRVWGDGDRLRQLLLNLVDNAIKYTPAGGQVALSLSQEGGQARIEIADTGVGIAEEDLHLIFERFYRVDKSRGRVQGGSGLGLSIAKWVAEAHGGNIKVVSKVGGGTTFTVLLPLMNGDKQSQSSQNSTVPEQRLHTVRSTPPP
jgi:two-component system, OmpR family, sensor kinase